ncbi:cation diffusion facilitator family transporter [Qipengyuania sp. JC766]|uniref:cation diffusion facilitator family transporter n=1 Tax=Qipengyuania sp. JC766 TaxID=3232139 RepID=UPI0034594AD9
MGAGHSHSHSHAHGDGHAHGPTNYGPRFALGVVLNSAFVVLEATYGFLSGSMALVADAGHNLSDVLALLLAWGASVAARKPRSSRYTYGYKSSTILAAMANALLLAVAIGIISYETMHRFVNPSPVEGWTMIIVAGIGIVVNLGTALLFLGGQHDLNIRGAFLHMAADALVSVGVVIAGLAILLTGLPWIDPLVSLLIVAVIAWGTWGLARDSVMLGLNAVPAGISESEVRQHLASLSGVQTVHDLHIWPMSTTETALTAHLVMPGGHPGDAFLAGLARDLEQRYRIGHTTIQVERDRDGCETGGC